MKKLNTSLTLLALSALVSLVAACSGNTNSISASSDSPGAGAVGVNVDIKTCQVGQAYSAQYGCMNRAQCQLGSGITAQTSGCIPGQLITEQLKFGSDPGTRHYGRVTITNAQQMELMLQASGLCSSSYGGYTSYVGTSSTACSQWIARGTFVILKSYTGSVDNINLTVGAGTQFPSDLVTILPGVYGSQLGYTGSTYASTNYISFNQQAHNYSFNNDNGMQIVGMSQGHPINFMLVVNNGNLGLDHLDGQLVYQGTQVATISLDRF